MESFHWVNCYDRNSSGFEFEQETLQAMPRLPLPENWNSNNFWHFMESQGHLFFIDFDCPEYIIYEMEKDCSKWTVKYHLDINLIVMSAFPDMTENKEISSNSVLLELKNFIYLVSIVEVKNEGPSLVLYVPGRFISYRLKDNTLKTLHDVIFHDSKRFQWYHSFSYMESLSYV
ncbi:F-box protein At5g07610-like [Durio zibethinus]|uniref:F-box protein At5g07610-like n=1 Tax=Durio zibethinus TaxID=66656 RepID=A0A6P6ALT1_DURZI|nr:F-box protein At5g07610-like [Durio zibethinus]